MCVFFFSTEEHEKFTILVHPSVWSREGYLCMFIILYVFIAKNEFRVKSKKETVK